MTAMLAVWAVVVVGLNLAPLGTRRNARRIERW